MTVVSTTLKDPLSAEAQDVEVCIIEHDIDIMVRDEKGNMTQIAALELYNGRFQLVVWESLASEDPSHIINARPKPPEPETDPRFWDCDCKTEYIHAKGVFMHCGICGAWAEDHPDSRKDEIEAGGDRLCRCAREKLR